MAHDPDRTPRLASPQRHQRGAVPPVNWHIHDYRESDLAAVVHLIDTTAELG
ncbi:AAA family ATPase, partial [Streptomyces sp. NPDC057674]